MNKTERRRAKRRAATQERREKQAALENEVLRLLAERGVTGLKGTVEIMKSGYLAAGRKLEWPYHGSRRNVRQLQNIVRWLSSGEKKPVKESDWVNSPEFLESLEWRKLRYRVLKACGDECLACGRGRADGVTLHVDHIKPRRKYPELALVFDNLQVLCHECNHGKGNWDETDWRR